MLSTNSCRPTTPLALLWIATVVAVAGCQPNNSAGTSGVRLPTTSSGTVKAQGQILPAGGFIHLSAAPGDVVAELKCQVGEDVKAGDELVVMRSAALREKQLSALDAQLVMAEQEHAQAIEQAKQQVMLAKAKLENVIARESSLPRKEALLELARKQVSAAQGVLQKMQSISSNHLTAEFIGDLEIDRQGIAVGESQLKLREQEEAFVQAKEDLAFAKDAAQLELQVAEDMLEAAVNSNATNVIEAQKATLIQEIESSKIVAPIDGTILAINAQPGEAGVRLPVIEMANTADLVCEVEINEMDAAKVQAGNPAVITSRAFAKDIDGLVIEKNAMVGRPQLKQLDPLARADYRTVTAKIQMNESAEAQNWLQLQVQVEIDTKQESADEADETAAAN